MLIYLNITFFKGGIFLKHLNIVSDLEFVDCNKGGCGECPVSCQTASKTSSASANQKCEHKGFQKDQEENN